MYLPCIKPLQKKKENNIQMETRKRVVVMADWLNYIEQHNYQLYISRVLGLLWLKAHFRFTQLRCEPITSSSGHLELEIFSHFLILYGKFVERKYCSGPIYGFDQFRTSMFDRLD